MIRAIILQSEPTQITVDDAASVRFPVRGAYFRIAWQPDIFSKVPVVNCGFHIYVVAVGTAKIPVGQGLAIQPAAKNIQRRLFHGLFREKQDISTRNIDEIGAVRVLFIKVFSKFGLTMHHIGYGGTAQIGGAHLLGKGIVYIPKHEHGMFHKEFVPKGKAVLISGVRPGRGNTAQKSDHARAQKKKKFFHDIPHSRFGNGSNFSSSR